MKSKKQLGITILILLSISIIRPVSLNTDKTSPVAEKDIENNNDSIKIIDHIPKLSSSNYIPEEWNQTFGGTKTDRASDIIVDDDGNLYFAGHSNSWGYNDFDDDGIIAKYDTNGNQIWNDTWATATPTWIQDLFYDIALDSEGNIYITASSAGKFSLVKYNISGKQEWNKTWVSPTIFGDIAVNSQDKIFVINRISDAPHLTCYNTSGGVEWDKVYDSYYRFSEMVIDSSDNIYLAGEYDNSGDYEIIIMKVNSNGNYLWHNYRFLSENQWVNGLGVDSSDQCVYIVGKTHQYDLYGNAFLLRFSSGGSYEWMKEWGTSSKNDYFQDVIVNDITDEIYVCGSTNTIGAGNMDIVLAKYNTAGTQQWIKSWGKSGSEVGLAMDMDLNYNIFIGGYTSSMGAGGDDALVMKVNFPPPNITIVSPESLDPFELEPPDFELTIDDPILHKTWYSLYNGTKWSANYTFQGTTGTINDTLWDSMPNGTITIRFHANNTEGDFTLKDVDILRDCIFPTIDIISPIENELFGKVAPNFTVAIQNADSGIYWYTFDGVNNQTFENNETIRQDWWTNLPNGTNTITFYANDSTGDTRSQSVEIRKDGYSPTINIISPTDGKIFNLTAPEFEVKINDTRLHKMWYCIDNGANHTFENNESFRQDWWSDLTNHSHTITFYANDSCGNVASKSIEIYIDKFAPLLSVETPSDGLVFNSSPEFIVKIKDGNILKRLYSLNNIENITFVSNGSIDQGNWSLLDDGFVFIRFYAIDSVGNINSSLVIVLKDTSNPSLKIKSPTSGITIGAISPNITINISDLTLNETWYTIEGTGENKTFDGIQGDNEVKIDQDLWTSLDDGSVTIIFYANDTFGRINMTSITLAKDDTAPNLNISDPSPEAKFSDISPNITLNIYDYSLNKTWYTIEGTRQNITFDGSNGENEVKIDQDLWASLDDGSVTIIFYANDTFGVINMTSITLTKDTYKAGGGGGESEFNLIEFLTSPIGIGMIMAGTLISVGIGTIVVKKRKLRDLNQNLI